MHVWKQEKPRRSRKKFLVPLALLTAGGAAVGIKRRRHRAPEEN